jgi:AcrR family transcriptional regulator
VRRNAVANRERIAEAALEVFAAGGPGASTEEVARRAGVGIGTVFRHFPTKDALVEEALLRHLGAVRAQAEGAVHDPDPGRALGELLRTMIASGGGKLTLAGMLGDPADPPAAVRAASGELRDVVGAVLRRAQEAGVADPEVSLEEVYVLLRALAESSAAGTAVPAVLERVARIVERGISKPLQSL